MYLNRALLSLLLLCLIGCAARSHESLTKDEKDELQRLTLMPTLCTVINMEEVSQSNPPKTPSEVLALASFCAPQCTAKIYNIIDYMEKIGLDQYFIRGYVRGVEQNLIEDAAYKYSQRNIPKDK